MLLRSALDPSIIYRISQVQKSTARRCQASVEKYLMAVLTNSVSNGACRYFSSAVAGMGLIYMW